MSEQDKVLKETREFADFLLSFGQAIQQANADGKINFMDAPLFLATFMKATTAIQGINAIPSEIISMTPEASESLGQFIRDKFDIDNDNIEIPLENALLHGIGLFKSIGLILASKKATS